MKNFCFVLFMILSATNAHAAKKALNATLKLDTHASKVSWMGKKISGFHTGFLLFKQGSFQVKKNWITSGDVVIDMTSLTNEDLKDKPDYKTKLENHLKGPDFFNIEKFPTAEFKIKSVEEVHPFAPGGPNALARGDLTLHGETHPAEWSFVYTPDAKGFTGKGKLLIDRTQYGLKYNSKKFFDVKSLGDKLIDDQFELEIDVTAVK